MANEITGSIILISSKWFLVATTVFCLGATARGENSNSLADGLVAYWKVDETEGTSARDATGNGHTGTLVQQASFESGRMGNAARLELKIHPPVGSRVTVEPFDIEGGGRHLTLAAWIHPYAFGRCAKRQARIIAKTESKGQYMGGTHHFTLTFWGQGLRFAMTTDTGRSDVITKPKLIEPHCWHHVAATWDGATMKVYLNGKLVGSETRDGDLLKAPSVGICIGNETKYIEGINFQGLLDDVRIYNRGLGDSEVKALSALGRVTAAAPANLEARKGWTL